MSSQPDPLLAPVIVVVDAINNFIKVTDSTAYIALLHVLGKEGSPCNSKTSTPQKIVDRTRAMERAYRGGAA